jgi:hypothetical protein
MVQAVGCRVLAIMGSGETSPTMVTVHKALAERLSSGSGTAVLLETPYGFQENAADVSARAQAYFARSVGLTVTVAGRVAAPGPGAAYGSGAGAAEDDRAGATGGDRAGATGGDRAGAAGDDGAGAAGGDGAAADDGGASVARGDGAEAADDGGAGAIRTADWVFAGPGSPSYALARWRDGPVADALRDRVAAGDGVTVLASAAAATMGFVALPVYEIYKAGAAPHWLDGLDLLGVLGLKVAVIPHYDNAEGGNHDTRYCYLGERRLSLLERALPADAAVLGVDEHTAAVFDLRAESLEVHGRGGVTVRRSGASTVLPSGTALTLARLRDLVRCGPRPGGREPAREPAAAATAETPPALPDIVRAAERRFDLAAASRQASGMVQAILDLEAAIHAWAGDTEEDQGTEQARAVLRGLVSRLGRAAQEGLCDPRDRLRPAVEPLVTLRAELRDQGDYPAADAIRDALAAAGLQLQDTADGPRWTPGTPGTPARHQADLRGASDLARPRQDGYPD